ncbi:MAG: aldehyde dehydrogenase family protein, partial [Bacteroidota bacterium]
MIEGVNFIGISESSAGTESIQAVDPSTNKPLEESFFIATDDEINRAVSAAKKAYQTYSTVSGEVKATFLDTIADEILNLGDTL